MKKQLLTYCFVIFILVICASSSGHSQVVREWVRIHDTLYNVFQGQVAVSLCYDDSANVYVAGKSQNDRYQVLKYSPAGTLLWDNIYNGYAGQPTKILSIGNGNFYLSGTNGLMMLDHLGNMTYLNGGYYVDIQKDASGYFYAIYKVGQLNPTYLQKLRYDGSAIWTSSHTNGPLNFYPSLLFLAVSEKINVYANYSYFLGGYLYLGNVYLTYDTSGNSLSSGNMPAGSGAISKDNYSNSNFFTGSWVESEWQSHIVFYRQDSTGVYRDSAIYNGPGNSKDHANAIVSDNAGGIYLACRSWGVAVDYDFVVLKFSTSGELLWEYRFNGSENSYDAAEKIAIDNGGNIIATGTVTQNSHGVQIYTVKLSPGGQLLWHDKVSRYNSPTDTNLVSDLQVDRHGNIYICGKTRLAVTGVYNFITIKYHDNTVGISNGHVDAMNYELFQNFPNPFNPETNIRFRLSESEIVTLRVYDCYGRLAASLADSRYSPGEHVIKWNASNLSSGVYMISFRTGSRSEIKKAVLLK
ncbi:MAG: T9SS type A sorting domain-containing protein [Ignavibacteria bacterium]|nr:T9SS type A sorting domain-containing protein [Ignavibacteria bacterium]